MNFNPRKILKANLLARCALVVALTLILSATSAWAIVPVGTTANFEMATVGYGAPVAPGLPVFGNGFVIQNGQVLISPGNGYPSLNAPAFGGADFFSAVNVPLGTVTTGPQVGFGGTLAQTSLRAVGTPFGGGGFQWLTPTFVHDDNGDGFATVSVSEATGAFTNTAPFQVLTRTGLALGVSGFVPNGAGGAISLAGSVFDPFNNIQVNLTPIVIAISGSPNDFAGAGTSSGLIETPGVLAGVPGIFYSAFGVSLGPFALFGGPADPIASRTALADLTMTIIADPMMTIEFDPGAIPIGLELPEFGGGDSIVPEPASIALLGIGGLGLAAVCFKRRRSN